MLIIAVSTVSPGFSTNRLSTKVYALKYGSVIRPDKYAVTIQRVEVESKENSVQDNEEHFGAAEQEIKKVNTNKSKN